MKSLLIACLLSFIYCTAQNTIEKRKAYVLELAANETQQYTTEIGEGPYFVKEKVLQLYCGEKVFVECEVINNSIVSMQVVAQNRNPERTIEINFTQDSKDRKQIQTMLEVINPFAKDLLYDAIMLTPNSKNWSKTSILPVKAKLTSYESWPHTIVSLALINWKLN
jgi:hypothetical protein